MPWHTRPPKCPCRGCSVYYADHLHRPGIPGRECRCDSAGERDNDQWQSDLHLYRTHRDRALPGRGNRGQHGDAHGRRLRHGRDHAGAPRRNGDPRSEHHERDGHTDYLRHPGPRGGECRGDRHGEWDGAGGERDVHVCGGQPAAWAKAAGGGTPGSPNALPGSRPAGTTDGTAPNPLPSSRP
jgi:hypothetical protein